MRDDRSEAWAKVDVRQCAAGHGREIKLIGLMDFTGQRTYEECYAEWARQRGINPWCGCRLEACPEPAVGT
jgi:hypothetical protein